MAQSLAWWRRIPQWAQKCTVRTGKAARWLHLTGFCVYVQFCCKRLRFSGSLKIPVLKPCPQRWAIWAVLGVKLWECFRTLSPLDRFLLYTTSSSSASVRTSCALSHSSGSWISEFPYPFCSWLLSKRDLSVEVWSLAASGPAAVIVEFEVYFHLRKSNAKAEKILIVLNFCNQVWPLISFNFNRASCNMASSGLFQELFLLEQRL